MRVGPSGPDQAGGAILNLITSFQVEERSVDAQAIRPPADIPSRESVSPEETPLFLDHRVVSRVREPEPRAVTWLRAVGQLADDPLTQACALAYLSDEDLLGVALSPHPRGDDWERLWAASLDHALWFHRPTRADDRLLFAHEGHGVASGRGMATARVFDSDGVHVATVAQEGLARERRDG